MQDECYALGLVAWVGTSLQKLISSARDDSWASEAVRQARVNALEKLRADCELPSVSIVVVGNTGAGSSSWILPRVIPFAQYHDHPLKQPHTTMSNTPYHTAIAHHTPHTTYHTTQSTWRTHDVLPHSTAKMITPLVPH